ncbi:hypothetical protein HA466_0319910 [Hirschfeldia incana]|nr:hypothetical protein HA466_0319910 [Hirschfeldia incana]
MEFSYVSIESKLRQVSTETRAIDPACPKMKPLQSFVQSPLVMLNCSISRLARSLPPPPSQLLSFDLWCAAPSPP